jgi:hypothetical protein
MSNERPPSAERPNLRLEGRQRFDSHTNPNHEATDINQETPEAPCPKNP